MNMLWGKASSDISTRISYISILAANLFTQIIIFNAGSAPRLRIPSFARRQSPNRYGENKVHRTDMMHSFIQHGMTPGEAERGGPLQLVAGSDTTATALRAALLFVATSPVVLARMRTEMANAGISPHRDTKSLLPTPRLASSRTSLPSLERCCACTFRLSAHWRSRQARKAIPCQTEGVSLPEPRFRSAPGRFLGTQRFTAWMRIASGRRGDWRSVRKARRGAE